MQRVFSLASAAHRHKQMRESCCRAGRLKTRWTEPLPRPSLWELNQSGCGVTQLGRCRKRVRTMIGAGLFQEVLNCIRFGVLSRRQTKDRPCDARQPDMPGPLSGGAVSTGPSGASRRGHSHRGRVLPSQGSERARRTASPETQIKEMRTP